MGVIAYSFFTQDAYFPQEFKPVVQLISGAFIGLCVTRQNYKEMKAMVRPLAVYLLLLVVICLPSGIIMCILAPQVDFATGLLATAPGGIADMALLSYDYGANTAQITTLQTLRLMLGLGVFPSISQWYIGRLHRVGKLEEIPMEEVSQATQEPDPSYGKNSRYRFLVTAAIAVLGGFLGEISGVPAGPLSFSMVFVAAYNIRTGAAYLPGWIRKAAQVLSGALVGATITRADIINLKYLLLPFVLIVAQYLFICYIVGPFIARRYHIGVDTMLLACNPAGVTDMALIAQDMGGDVSKVAVFQIVRLFGTLTIFPILIKLLVGWLG